MRGSGANGATRTRPSSTDHRPATKPSTRNGRPDLAALDHGGAVLVREHATTVVMAQDEVVEAWQQARRRGGVAAGQWRAREVVELAAVLVAESP